MNSCLKIKSLCIVVGILLLINIATLGIFWYTKIKTEPPMIPPMPDKNNSFLADELGFTGEQLQRFEVLKKEHRQGVETILRQTKELKDELFDCIKTGDDAKAKDAATKLGENNKNLELLTYEHFKDVRKICNDLQREKFDRILKDLVRGIDAQAPPQMRPPPRERPPLR